MVFSDYVPSQFAGVPHVVDKSAFYAMQSRRKTLGPGKWRMFSKQDELLLQQLSYDNTKMQLRLHSFYMNSSAPWVHECVTTTSTRSTVGKHVSPHHSILVGSMALTQRCSDCVVSLMGRVGGGNGFKLVPAWCLPLAMNGAYSEGRIQWNVNIADNGNIMLTFSTTDYTGIADIPRWYQVEIDNHIPAWSPRMRKEGTSWANPYAYPQGLSGHLFVARMRRTSAATYLDDRALTERYTISDYIRDVHQQYDYIRDYQRYIHDSISGTPYVDPESEILSRALPSRSYQEIALAFAVD